MHRTIGSTVLSRHLNSFDYCICTTTMTNIRPDRDSNLVPPGYKPPVDTNEPSGPTKEINGKKQYLKRAIKHDVIYLGRIVYHGPGFEPGASRLQAIIGMSHRGRPRDILSQEAGRC